MLTTLTRLFAGAPVLVVPFILYVTFNGEVAELLSWKVWAFFACLSVLGVVVAWSLMSIFSEKNLKTIDSAPDGYVALQGKAHRMPGEPDLLSPGKHKCLWFYHAVKFHHTPRTRTHDMTGSLKKSTTPFLLVDSSGECVVYPEGGDVRAARVVIDQKVLHESFDHRSVREEVIEEGDPIYVVGQFKRTGNMKGSQPTISAPKWRVFLLGVGEMKDELRRDRIFFYADLAVLALSLIATIVFKLRD